MSSKLAETKQSLHIVVAAFVLAFTIPTYAQSPALELKGYSIGAPFAKSDRKDFQRCASNDALGDYCLKRGVSIGPTTSKMMLVFYKQDRVTGITITFQESDFDEMHDAVVAKYGKPKSSNTSTVQNAMGAKFQQDEVAWTTGDATLSLIRRGTDLNTAMIELVNASAMADFDKKNAEKTKKAAGNL